MGLKVRRGTKSEQTLFTHLFVALATLAKRVCTSPYFVLVLIKVKEKHASAKWCLSRFCSIEQLAVFLLPPPPVHT